MGISFDILSTCSWPARHRRSCDGGSCLHPRAQRLITLATKWPDAWSYIVTEESGWPRMTSSLNQDCGMLGIE